MSSSVSTASIPPWNRVYRLQDLENWTFKGPSLAVLGHPIAHSLSPQIHNAALQQMGPQFAGWRYFAFDVPVEHLGEGLTLFHQKNFQGINLTIPHKVEALSVVADIDPVAKKMGAVNTLIRQEQGYLGRNTDGFGIQNALLEELSSELSGADIIILGAGGAARATVVQCLESNCNKVWVGNRSEERLSELIQSLGGENPKVLTFPLSAPPKSLPTSSILINATSLGLRPDDPSPADLSTFPRNLRVYDMIYNPPETALLAQARKLGMPAANGLSMLVYQAAKSLSYWTDSKVPVNTMFQALADSK